MAQSTPAVVSFALDFPLEALIERIDHLLPSVLKAFDKDDHSVTVHRIEPVTISTIPGTLRFNLHTEIAYRLAYLKVSFPATPRTGWYADESGNLDSYLPPHERPSFFVHADCEATLEDDWTVKNTLHSLQLVPHVPATVGFLGIDFDVTKYLREFAEPRLSGALKEAFTKLSSDLTFQLQSTLKSKLNDLWRILSAQRPVSGVGVFFLCPKLLKIARPCFVPESKLRLGVALDFSPEVQITGEPALPPIPSPPKAVLVDALGSGFDVTLRVLVLEDMLRRTLGAAIGAKKIYPPAMPASHSLEFEAPKIVFVEDALQVSMNYVSGPKEGVGAKPTRGTVRVSGVPKLEEGKIVVASLQSSTDPKDIIVDGALPEISSRFVATLQRLQEIEIHESSLDLDRLRFLLATSVKELGFEFETAITAGTLSAKSVSVDMGRKALAATFRLNGRAEGKIRDLPFRTPVPAIETIEIHYDIYNENKESEGGLLVSLSRNGQKYQLTSANWGLGESWEAFYLQQTTGEALKGLPAVGRYKLDIDITAGERIDNKSEVYLVIKLQGSNSILVPIGLWYHKWMENDKHESFEFEVPLRRCWTV